jgi:hypothetical protein
MHAVTGQHSNQLCGRRCAATGRGCCRQRWDRRYVANGPPASVRSESWSGGDSGRHRPRESRGAHCPSRAPWQSRRATEQQHIDLRQPEQHPAHAAIGLATASSRNNSLVFLCRTENPSRHAFWAKAHASPAFADTRSVVISYPLYDSNAS